MKAISQELQDHLAGPVTTLATCWRLDLKDGTVMGFTDHDHPIDYDGVRYEARGGFDASTIQTTGDLAVDELEVDALLDSDGITEADLAAGRYDHAEITIFSVNYNDLSMGHITWRRGWLGEVSPSNGIATAEVRGLTQALKQPIGETYTAACRADFMDSRCRYGWTTVLKFDGVSDHVDCTNAIWVNHSQQTAECWFYREQDQAESTNHSTKNVLLAKASDNDNDNFEVGTSGSDVILYLDTAGGSGTQTFAANIRDNAWHHLAITFNGGLTHIFLDGEEVGSYDWGGDMASDADPSPFAIGKSLHQGAPFKGKISDVRVWSIVRTQAEIQNAKDERLSGSESGLVAYYKLDEGSGETATDSAGSNDGTINGAIWSAGNIRVGGKNPRVTGSVTSAADPGTFSDSNRTEESGWFDYGVVTWTSGANAGLSAEIRYFNGSQFGLFEPMPYAIAAGDTYEVTPGCDKRLQTCRDKYDNVVNFRGEPYIPGRQEASRVGGNGSLSNPGGF